jgi:hypothetical protein
MPTFEIKDRWSERVLFSADGDSLRYVVRSASLSRADLSRASLSEADLYGADLYGADLYGADLYGAKIAWTSHTVVAELLKRAAEIDVEKRKIAGLILISTDWCWEDFLALKISPKLKKWALDTLAQYVTEGDRAPEAIASRAEKLK